MPRAPRSTARNLTLAIAGALLFIAGYFAGSRYAENPLQGLNIVPITEPVALSSPMGVQLGGHWQLLLLGDVAAEGCRRQLARMARIHNRLAHRADLTKQLGLLAVSINKGDTPLRSDAPTAHWQTHTTDHAGLLGLAKQLGILSADLLQCRDQPIALIDPMGRLRALVPASLEPKLAASDLERLLDHIED